MSFSVALSETYSATVSVQLPGDKAVRKFDLEYFRKSQDEIESLIARAKSRELNDKQFAREIVSGWKDRQVLDEEGNAVEFSAQALEDLMSIYPVPSAIVEAFYTSISGARVKN